MKNYSLIIWDFNGTLLDDVGAALSSVNDMLVRRGKPPIGLAEYREYIDVPIRGFYERVLDLENEDYDQILSEFQSGYERHVKSCGLTQLVLPALEKARDKHIPQVVLSSSEQSQLERLLKTYGIYDFFDAVLGADDILAGSKIERAEKYMEAHGTDTASAIVIGDLLHDCDVAAAIGSECLLLTSGHHDRERLESAGVRVEDTLESFINEQA